MTRRAGFTLLEVLIAFVIAALAIGVMIDGIVGGLRSSSAGAQVAQAVALARSRMAAAEALVLSGPPPQSAQTGQDGAFRWRVDITPTATAALPRPAGLQVSQGGPPPAATLYGIKVTVSWGESAARQVRLDGAQLRMSSAAPAS